MDCLIGLSTTRERKRNEFVFVKGGSLFSFGPEMSRRSIEKESGLPRR